MSSIEARNPLVKFAVERRVTTTMGLLGVIVLGWISVTRIPLEFLPAFSSQNISVRANYGSSSPEEVRREIVQPLEESLATINGIEMLSSSASASSARVNVTFLDGVDMDWAAVEVRDRVDRVRHLLPDDLERVTISRFQSDDIPVVRFQVSSDWEKERLYRFAEDVLQRRLERLDGIAAVEVGGLRTPELQVNLDPGRLRSLGVDVRDVSTALRQNNMNVSAGDIREGSRKYLVRAVGEFHSPDEVRRQPLSRSNLTIGDVAEVDYRYPEQWSYNFLNGVEALTVSVNNESGGNLLAAVDAVKDELDAIMALPEAEGLTVRIFSDASRDVRKGLSQLQRTGLIGGALALGAVFLFLRRFRTTLLIGLAMPASVIATFVLLFFLRQLGWSDVTINVISLAGMMLALGMLVDNSVVVIESIYRHRNELGRDAMGAALHGASEVALPITASTITTMCVFLPLIFLGSGGRFSLYFENVGIMICIVIVSSLLVALTVVPMTAVLLLRGQAPRTVGFSDKMLRGYRHLLKFTLHHRFVFLAIMGLLLWGSWDLFNSIERSFAQRSLEREVTIRVDTPRQYSFDQTKTLYEELYGLLDARRDELDIADITYSYNRGSGRSGGGWSRSRRVNVYLQDEEESQLSTIEVRDRIRALLPVRAGVEMRIESTRGRGGGGVELELTGDEPQVLELIADQVVKALEAIPSLQDVGTSLENGNDEIQVRVNEAVALQAGLSSQAVAQTISSALSSRPASFYRTSDEEVDLIVQYPEEERETLSQLRNVPVYSGGTARPLAALAAFERAPGPRSIERTNHQQTIEVEANTSDPRASFRAMGAVTQVMNQMAMPPGYSWSFGRWNRYQQRDQNTGLLAIWMALPLVYMVLAALFESFVQPFTIMLAVPFALLGVGVVMHWAEQPWDNMTMIGLIVLIGVVVNNAIVLLDHINTLRKSGLSREEAILQGGQHRLRPILITAVTTILGMMPMIAPILWPQWFGPLEGRASTWAPIALVIVGGLTTSTFLTLLIIPTFYSLLDDLARWFRRIAREA